VDDGVYAGWTIPTEYDSLLGKLIAWGNSREESIARLRRALQEYAITGIKTNVGLFRRIVAEPDFVNGEIHTRWLDELLKSRPAAAAPTDSASGESTGAADAAVIAAALWHLRRNSPEEPAASQEPSSRWKLEGRQTDRTP
jgi:acetyl-CoA carboxylase biotin carboxylase subunit